MSSRALTAAIAGLAVCLGAAAIALVAAIALATRSPARVANATSAVSEGLIVGLNANVSGWGGASTAPRLDRVVSSTGARWLREVFDWAAIEPSPGHFDFAYYDHFMRLAARRGEHVLPVLYDTPAWAGTAPTAIPSDPAAFGRYVAAVVGRYGAGGSFWQRNHTLAGSAIHTWELWNEPYSATGDDNDYDPAAYARLVRAAAIAGRAADRDARFLMAAETQSSLVDGRWRSWVDSLYAAVPDLDAYFDGVAVHDYGNAFGTPAPMVAGRPYTGVDDVRRIEEIRREFLAHAADKPFWITEAGWSTCRGDAICVSDAQQATDLASLFDLIHDSWSGWVKAAFIYSYADGTDPRSTLGGYGLTAADGAPKPALAVFRAQATAGAG